MRFLTLGFILAMGGLSLGTFATSSTIHIGAHPTDLIAADLNISEQAFVDCFIGVTPNRNHAPDSAAQRANKAIMLPCLQSANPAITDDVLDAVMISYQPVHITQAN